MRAIRELITVCKIGFELYLYFYAFLLHRKNINHINVGYYALFLCMVHVHGDNERSNEKFQFTNMEENDVVLSLVNESA